MIPKQIIYPLSYIRPFSSVSVSNEEREFKGHLTKFVGSDAINIPLGRARMGLYLFAKHFIRKDRRRIILSPLTIPDVVNMILLAGGEPIFVDNLPASTNINVDQLSELIDEKTACVMITHYHVNQNQYNDLIKCCRDKDVGLFEDCAISLGGIINGKSVGLASDGGVFSLSSFKFWNYYWGGLLFASEEKKVKDIKREVESWKRLSFNDYWGQIVSTFIYDMATRPILFPLVTAPIIRKKLRLGDKEAGLQHRRIENTEISYTLKTQPPGVAFREWNRKVNAVISALNHRQRIAAIYDKYLSEYSVSSETVQEVKNGSCYINYPIAIPDCQRSKIYKDLVLGKNDVGLSLYPNCHEHPSFCDVKGYSEEIYKLTRSVIYLPTHIRVTADYAEKLALKIRNLV